MVSQLPFLLHIKEYYSFMKKFSRITIGLILILALGLSGSIDAYAKKQVPIDTSVEDSRESGTDLYEAMKCHNQMALDITVSDGSSGAKLHDEDRTSTLTLAPQTVITVKSQSDMHGIYIIWDCLVPEWTLRINGQEYTYGQYGFLHEYVELPEMTSELEIIIGDGKSLGDRPGTVNGMRIADIYAFESESLPSFVQLWQPPTENADIMVVTTHSDDEQIFFGGFLPVYQAEQGLNVQYVYVAQHWVYDAASKIREHEKLDGIYLAGARYYPITSDISDNWSESADGAAKFSPYELGEGFLAEAIRRCKPQVIVTHDFDGEYGHGQHMYCNVCTINAFDNAGDASYFADSAAKYGTWTPSKLYIHLLEDKHIKLDLRRPLSSFGGKTAIEVARQAYLCYESQQWCWFTIDDYGETDNSSFGLYRTMVGDDTGNDVMEHITPYKEQNGEIDLTTFRGKTCIYTVDDLKGIADNPNGSYILMNDIDMTGVDWKPIDFYGVFDGNGNCIMNLEVNTVGDVTRTTYDGNYKEYDTTFAGLFGVLENASVMNLKLLGVHVDVDSDVPCFVGTLAGWADGTNISGCEIEGYAGLDVQTTEFGVGGIVGYGGNGSIKDTKADVTLVVIDYDKENRDEEFLGGGYAAGNFDVDGVTVNIKGYCSDHGYVHNGGLVGMYVPYPSGNPYEGYIKNTRVEGFITFFEDNTDRRAYCEDFVGETLRWQYQVSGNSSDFTRDEVMDYSEDLVPHKCENPSYSETLISGDCYNSGYTTFTCDACGYAYKGSYTGKVHDFQNSETIQEATYDRVGYNKLTCAVCGVEKYEELPIMTMEIVERGSVSDDSASVSDNQVGEKSPMFIVIVIGSVAVAALLIAGGVILVGGNSKKKRRRKRKKNHSKTKSNRGSRSGQKINKR